MLVEFYYYIFELFKIFQIFFRSRNDSCGFEISYANWMNNFELMIKAKIDNLYDGDVMQNVKLLGMVVTNGKLSKTSELHSLEVRNAGLEKGVSRRISIQILYI